MPIQLPSPRETQLTTAAVPNYTAASLLESLGNVGLSAYKGYLRGKLQAGIDETKEQRLATEAFGVTRENADLLAEGLAIAQGSIEDSPEFLAFMENDPHAAAFKKRLDAATAGIAQGVYTPLGARARINEILKETIKSAPGFTDELTSLASKTMGYPVTDEVAAALFGIDPRGSSSGPKTDYEKLVDNLRQANPSWSNQRVQLVASETINAEVNARRVRAVVDSGTLNEQTVAAAVAADSSMMLLEWQNASLSKLADGTMTPAEVKRESVNMRNGLRGMVNGYINTSADNGYSIRNAQDLYTAAEKQLDDFLEVSADTEKVKVLEQQIKLTDAEFNRFWQINQPESYHLINTLGPQAYTVFIQTLKSFKNDAEAAAEFIDAAGVPIIKSIVHGMVSGNQSYVVPTSTTATSVASELMKQSDVPEISRRAMDTFIQNSKTKSAYRILEGLRNRTIPANNANIEAVKPLADNNKNQALGTLVQILNYLKSQGAWDVDVGHDGKLRATFEGFIISESPHAVLGIPVTDLANTEEGLLNVIKHLNNYIDTAREVPDLGIDINRYKAEVTKALLPKKSAAPAPRPVEGSEVIDVEDRLQRLLNAAP